jgi:hypothetical protein
MNPNRHTGRARLVASVALFAASALISAQAQRRPPDAATPSLDIKTPREPSVQTFPSERATRPHPAARMPGDRSSVPIGSVNRDPEGWMPNQPDQFAPKPTNRPLDPRVPKQGLRPVDYSRMYYSTRDGTVWARGEHYKASFDSSGVTYYPIFGKRQPQHHPHALSPDSVTLGGEPLPFERSAPPGRVDNRIQIDRGAFTEAYDLTPQTLEQTFVFSALPRSGELVLHIPVASELAACAGVDGLEFRSELGRVTFGRATAIDARGRRAEASIVLEKGAISIRVDADFVASAALPLVIDPVVSTFAIDDTMLDAYWADAAYDAPAHQWYVVYEDWVTSTDRDCWLAVLRKDGSVIFWLWVDGSTDSWDSVHIADNALHATILIVASVTHNNQVSVWGCWAWIGGQPPDWQFITTNYVPISGGEAGTVRNCVVGGDPWTVTDPSYFCVVYERQYSATDWDILVRMVDSWGTVIGTSPIYLSNSAGTIDVGPAISKSDGTHDWMIAWQRNNGVANDADVWGSIVRFDGLITANPFQISAWYQPEWQVAVSSPLGSAANPPADTMRYLVTWQVTDGGDNDIVMALLDGTTKLDQQDLSIDEQYNYTLDQIESTVDSDGDQFLVAYSELYSWPDYDIYASDVYLTSTNTLALAQRHVNIDYDSTKDHSPRVVSCAMSGETNPVLKHRYLAAWNSSPNPTGPADVRGALFDNFDAGQATSFCFGDGTGAPCPCGNNGFTGHGCQNSSGTGGGLLIASGVASLANDTLLFTTQNEKPTALSTVNQGDAQIVAVPFGQGLRCAGGHLKRLYTHSATNGTIMAPIGADAPVHARSAALGDTIIAGSARYYYVYYRDQTVLGGCSAGATFNSTQHVAVTWAP